MKILKKIERWFDLKFGWFFVNGFKHDEWLEYLQEKYDTTEIS
tara:strand:+ start:431 stop:559 length:129 start_codon:yes stop_codon:yes gene_type:complete